MKTWFVLALLLVLPLVPGVAAEPFLQHRSDAGRTGVVLDSGPIHLDHAFSVQLPGARAIGAPPLILDDAIYVLTAADDSLPGRNTTALWRVSLDDAMPDIVVDLAEDAPVSGLASDGQRFFIAGQNGVRAVDLEGNDLWTTPFGLDDPLPGTNICVPPAVTDDIVFVACTRWYVARQTDPVEVPGIDDPVATGAEAVSSVFAQAFDRTTGEAHPIWQRNRPDMDPEGDEAPAGVFLATGSAVVEDTGLVMTYAWDRASSGARQMLFALEDGTERWAKSTWLSFSIQTIDRQATTWVVRFGADLAATPSAALTSSGVLTAVDPAQGDTLWTFVTGGDVEQETGVPGEALAVQGSQVYVAASGRLLAYDAAGQSVAWIEPTTHLGAMTETGMLLAGGRLWYAAYGPGGEDLYVADANDGKALRRLDRNLTSSESFQVVPAQMLAIGEGVFVAAGSDGFVSVWGPTAASIAPVVAIDDRYPEGGQPLTVDLSGSRPGAQAEDMEFRIDWGDERQTFWTNATSFEHTYEGIGEREITVFARNSAGQESRASATVFPGIVAPRDPTFLESAFAAENQETTFFVLGLMATLVFAAFSVVRLRRKRGVLRRELKAADDIVAANPDDPDAMREQLRTHRLRARRLFLDGRLDEGSTGILERHIDELLRDHRLSSVEAELAFLPHGLFRSMQEMLRDARVTQMERNNFLAALDADGHLTAAEKKRVKRHVEAWHREDAV